MKLIIFIISILLIGCEKEWTSKRKSEQVQICLTDLNFPGVKKGDKAFCNCYVDVLSSSYSYDEFVKIDRKLVNMEDNDTIDEINSTLTTEEYNKLETVATSLANNCLKQ